VLTLGTSVGADEGPGVGAELGALLGDNDWITVGVLGDNDGITDGAADGCPQTGVDPALRYSTRDNKHSG